MGAKTRFAGQHCSCTAMLAGMARSYSCSIVIFLFV